MKRVLIVDDAKSIRSLLATCLDISGFSVDMAESGKAALEKITTEPFDLIFLDIKLPMISGTEVLRRIREKGINVPVVIITAFGNIKNAIDCTKLGAVAYIQKPFTANRIHSVLDELHIKSDESKDQTYLNEVNILFEKEKFEDVEKILKNVLSNNPLDAEVYHLLAEVNKKLKNKDAAEKYLKIYHTLNE